MKIEDRDLYCLKSLPVDKILALYKFFMLYV